MLFINTYLQPLSLYPGGLIKINYLYEHTSNSILKDKKKNLLSLFYFDKSDFYKKSILINISVVLSKKSILINISVESYTIHVYELDQDFNTINLSSEVTIKEIIESSSSIWQATVSNKFLLLFSLRELSHRIGRGLNSKESLKICLERFDFYRLNTINNIESGFDEILRFIIKEKIFHSSNINRDFLIHKDLANPFVSKLKNWYTIWQLYIYQKHDSIWQEAIKWLCIELEKHRRNEALLLLIKSLTNKNCTNRK